MTLENDVAYDTRTYQWKVPEIEEDSVFVKIARENGHIWIDTSVGKAGTPLNADAYAISALAGQALRGGVPVDKIVRTLKGITHENTNHLLARSQRGALSVADAIGRSIELDYARGEHRLDAVS
jgi:hypothetical protein